VQQPYAQVAETHSAVVFFVGDRAYKLKKPVDLGFLDFSTAAARAAACAREVELNRRYAPDVYLGLAEIRGTDGEVCDHLVVMRRMPAARRLSALVQAGAPVTDTVRQVARIVAAQHAAAPRGPQIDEQGGRDALRKRWADNFDQVRQSAGDVMDPAVVADVQQLAWEFLAGRKALFDARVGAGRIVDGHGDLLAGDIFCLDDGPRILDCLDFDDRLRWLDGLDDAACLAMDLEHLGEPPLADRFIRWYAEYSGDPAPPSLCHHYIAYRAFVRAKVAGLRSGQGDPGAAREARRLADIADGHLREGAVALVLIGGLPGTGKSALAGAVAGRLGATVLSSDRIRKELAGLPAAHQPAVPYGSGIYAPTFTDATYAELLRRAGVLLGQGELVLADASWTSAGQRAAAASAARSAGARLIQLQCTAPADITGQRLRSRISGASDADRDIARRMAADMAAWPEAVTIDTGPGSRPGGRGGGDEQSGVPDAVIGQAVGAIRCPQPVSASWHPRPCMPPG
jgi:uncharacterized protein